MKYVLLLSAAAAAAATAALLALGPTRVFGAATTRVSVEHSTTATTTRPTRPPEHIARLVPYLTPGRGASAEADRKRASQLAARAEWLIGDDQDAAAAGALVEAFTADPRSPDALLLASALAADAGLLDEATAGLRSLLEDSPNHVPALNNLGVVLWRMARQAEALSHYDRALAKSPLHLVVVHNLHEAFGAFPDESADRPAAELARKRLAARELSVASAMERRGMFRWGSGWVTELQLRELKATEKVLGDELRALERDYLTTTSAIAKIDRQLADIDRQISRINETERRRRPAGNAEISAHVAQRSEEPSRAAQDQSSGKDLLEVRHSALVNERAVEMERLTTLREQAAALNGRFHVPRYTGRHVLVNTQGEPLRPADDARIKRPAAADPVAAVVTTTRPASAPSTNPSQNTQGSQR